MSAKKAEPAGLFDGFLEPFELKQQSIPKAKRAPLRVFLILEPSLEYRAALAKGRHYGVPAWRQVDEVLAANLTTAGAVALEARGKKSAPWAFPKKGAAVAKLGRQRFAVIDPTLLKVDDLDPLA